jgi:hypothetical protein
MRAIGEVQGASVIADLDTGYGNSVNVAYLVPRSCASESPSRYGCPALPPDMTEDRSHK